MSPLSSVSERLFFFFFFLHFSVLPITLELMSSFTYYLIPCCLFFHMFSEVSGVVLIALQFPWQGVTLTPTFLGLTRSFSVTNDERLIQCHQR